MSTLCQMSFTLSLDLLISIDVFLVFLIESFYVFSPFLWFLAVYHSHAAVEGCDTREVLWRDKAMAASTSRRHLRRPASCPLTSPAPGPVRGDHVLPGRPLQAVQLTEEQGPEAEETSRSGWSGSKCNLTHNHISGRGKTGSVLSFARVRQQSWDPWQSEQSQKNTLYSEKWRR